MEISYFVSGKIKGKNGFGLKYLDSSSLEFGRKLLKDSGKFSIIEPSVDKSRVVYDLNNHKSQDETISSSLSVSSSETVQIETSLDDQELVKPSRVKKRNFSVKNPNKSAHVLQSHIDSNNFRHTSKLPVVQADSEV